MPQQQRLPFPYRPEAGIVSSHVNKLAAALDWAAAAPLARPWVQAVRDNPPPFWAMESLLKEYPISSAEGLALMRLAEALLRVPDAETAIALTADQLGRADFDGASDGVMARLSASAIAMSKKFLPEDGQTSIMSKLGARTVVAATLRAVQLLGRQFVLGQTIEEGMKEAASARKKLDQLRFSFDMLGEGARTDADALKYLTGYQNAAYARTYQDFVAQVQAVESPWGKTALSEAVARYLFKLMAYKDEYEVARLHTDPAFLGRIHAMFEGDFKLHYHLAPPLIAKKNAKGELIKQSYGPALRFGFKLLARLKGLRGTALDVFGRTEERRLERALIVQYRACIEELLRGLNANNHAAALEIARLPEQIRGYGHVKARHWAAVRPQWEARMADWRRGDVTRQAA